MKFTKEDDCVSKCLLADGIWQLRQKLLDYVQINSYDFIETASVSEQPVITFEQLVTYSMDENTVDALNDVAQRFSVDLETLRLHTVCERQQMIPESSSIWNIQQMAIDSSSSATVDQQLPYTVQVPDTPRRLTNDDDEYAEAMSVTSIETQTSPIVTR